MDDSEKLAICKDRALKVRSIYHQLHPDPDELLSEGFLHAHSDDPDEYGKQAYLWMKKFTLHQLTPIRARPRRLDHTGLPNEQALDLYRALEQLDELSKQLVLLIYWRGLSTQEVADLTQCTRRSVQLKLKNTIERLRALLTINGDS